MLDDKKDYVVYRHNRTGDVFQTHKGLYAEWEKLGVAKNLTLLVNNVTQNEATQFCRLTRED